MVGTGVLMSQLLLEYVLDTTQDLEKRQWVYELWHMSDDESWWVMMSHVMMSHDCSDPLYVNYSHKRGKLGHLTTLSTKFPPLYLGCWEQPWCRVTCIDASSILWHSWFWVDTILAHPMSSPPYPSAMNDLNARNIMALLWKRLIPFLKRPSVAPGRCWPGIWFEMFLSGSWANSESSESRDSITIRQVGFALCLPSGEPT